MARCSSSPTRFFAWAALLIVLVVATRAHAAPEVSAVRVPRGTITLDGDAADWAGAPRTSGFVQREPRAGAAPVAETRVAVRYDDRALYVLVEALEPRPAAVRALLTRRDEASPSDWVEVWLDPQSDRLTGYRFAVNARGVLADSRLSKGGAVQDANWDAAWDAKVRRTATGWVAELRIPFSELRRDPKVTSWGLQVRRWHAAAMSESVLAPQPRLATRPLMYAGRLTGLGARTRAARVALLPYAAGAVEREDGAVQLTPRAGGDVRLDVGRGTTFRGTVNPDFGQVESDPSELNLTAFETFRAERRQFFLEGRDALAFPLALRNGDNESLYYSRRIGGRPVRDLGLEEPDTVDEYPRESTILGAAQLIGRQREGYGFAALTALTGPEHARVTVDGVAREPRVAPLTSTTVARVQREVGQGSSVVGATATHVERRLEGDLDAELVRQATTGGVDFDLRRGDLAVVGHVAGSHLAGSAAAVDTVQRSAAHYLQRPDADHVRYDPERTTLSGFSAELIGGKLDGAPLRGGWGVSARSPGFDANDAGFLKRADEQHAEVWGEWHQSRARGLYRYYKVDGAVWLDKTFGDELVGTGFSASTWWHFANNTTGYLGTMWRQSLLDPSLLRGGPAFALPPQRAGWWGVGSDDRKPVKVLVSGDFTLRDEQALTLSSLGFEVLGRPSSATRLSLAPRWIRRIDDLQFVTDDPRIVLGHLRRDDLSLAFRASVALALGLTVEAYAMPFISAGTYARFYTVVDPRAARYADRIAETPYDGDDRFEFAQLRSNLVVRWDYAAGSRVYLVWAHEQTRDVTSAGSVVLGRDLRALAGEPAFDVVMLKLEQLLRW